MKKKHGFHKNIQLYLFIFENEFLETSHVTRTVPMKVVCITLVGEFSIERIIHKKNVVTTRASSKILRISGHIKSVSMQ